MKIPETGRSREEILEALDRYTERDMDWRSSRAFGYIFDPGQGNSVLGAPFEQIIVA